MDHETLANGLTFASNAVYKSGRAMMTHEQLKKFHWTFQRKSMPVYLPRYSSSQTRHQVGASSSVARKGPSSQLGLEQPKARSRMPSTIKGESGRKYVSKDRSQNWPQKPEHSIYRAEQLGVFRYQSTALPPVPFLRAQALSL